MAKIQRNFRLEPDVDAALSAASDPDSNPKTAIVDRALRRELLDDEVMRFATTYAMLLEVAQNMAGVGTHDHQALRNFYVDEILSRAAGALDNLVRPASDGTPGSGDDTGVLSEIIRELDGTPEVEPSPPESRVSLEVDDGEVVAVNGEPPTREPSEADVRGWFTSLDGIDQQKIMVGLGLVAPPAPEQIATHTTASFEAILNQVESAPEETRRAVLERLLGEQLKAPADDETLPAYTTPPVPPGPELTATERAIAQEISVEQGLDMPTAERMARRIVQKRAEAL